MSTSISKVAAVPFDGTMPPAWPVKAFEFATSGMWFKCLKSDNNKSDPVHGRKPYVSQKGLKHLLGINILHIHYRYS